jgi:hypothetical protein
MPRQSLVVNSAPNPCCPSAPGSSPPLAVHRKSPSISAPTSIQPLSGVVLGRHHEPLTLARAPVHRLDDIDQLLLTINSKVDLIIIPRAKVDLDVFIPIPSR